MKRTYRNAISTAVTFAFAAALSLPAWAQEKPQEGAPAMQQKPAPKMEKKAAAKKAGLPEVMAVQEALKKAGENPGPADGKMGRKTRAALRAFQKKNGLKTTGQADKATMAKLQSFMGK